MPTACLLWFLERSHPSVWQEKHLATQSSLSLTKITPVRETGSHFGLFRAPFSPRNLFAALQTHATFFFTSRVRRRMNLLTSTKFWTPEPAEGLLCSVCLSSCFPLLTLVSTATNAFFCNLLMLSGNGCYFLCWFDWPLIQWQAQKLSSTLPLWVLLQILRAGSSGDYVSSVLRTWNPPPILCSCAALDLSNCISEECHSHNFLTALHQVLCGCLPDGTTFRLGFGCVAQHASSSVRRTLPCTSLLLQHHLWLTSDCWTIGDWLTTKEMQEIHAKNAKELVILKQSKDGHLWIWPWCYYVLHMLTCLQGPGFLKSSGV